MGGFQGSSEFPAIHGIPVILITSAWKNSSFQKPCISQGAKDQQQWACAYLKATGMTVFGLLLPTQGSHFAALLLLPHSLLPPPSPPRASVGAVLLTN